MDHSFEAVLLGLMVMIPSTIGAISTLRNGKVVRRNRDALLDIADDGNGGKRLGIAVHDIAQSVEFLSAQSHTNTSEILTMAEKLDTHADLLKEHIAETKVLRDEYEEMRPGLLDLVEKRDG
jgi:hypothetical protein